MNSSQKDDANKDQKNTVSLNALKYIKFLLDRIETSRELNPNAASEFEISVKELAHPDISHYNDFKGILKKLESIGILTFDELEEIPEGDILFLRIFVKDWSKFDEYHREVNNSYEKLARDKNFHKSSAKTSKSEIWWIRTNPFWILWQGITFAWRWKIVSVIVIILTLLATDYSLAWKNFKWIINQISRLSDLFK